MSSSSTAPRRRIKAPLVTLSCSFVSYIHTFLGFGAFFGALVLALSLHYKRVVKNGVAGYPDEWWPSVSATIGDWPHERSFLQLFIAMMSGPRFALVLLSALLVSLSAPYSNRARWIAFTGTLRTLSCGGWVFFTSTDFAMVHDVAMITYLVLTPAWMYISWGSLAPQPNKRILTDRNASTDTLAEKARKSRRNTAIAFFASIPFMCYFYYRHKVLLIPGAYTIYSFFEWNLIIQDLLFDLWSLYDLCRLEIHIVEADEPTLKPAISGSWWHGGANAALKEGAWSTAPQVASSRGRKEEADAQSLHDANETARTSIMDLGPLRTATAAISETYLAFLWWTTLTGLHPVIFYFSVSHLQMAGAEAFLLSQVFALGLSLLPPLRRMLLTPQRGVRDASRTWQGAMWALTLLSIGTWWVPSPHARLGLTGLANFAASVMQAVEWGSTWQEGPAAFQRKIVIWLVGLSLSSLSKYANHSNNPLWPFMNSSNGGLQPLGLVLAAICIVELLSRHQPRPQRRARAAQAGGSETRAALGVGAILFSLHMFLTDSGTMIAWGWTGYPVKGPMAVPHGWIVLTVAVLSTGLVVARPAACYSLVWVAALAVGNAILLIFNDWTSFLGALITAASLPPLVLPIADGAMRQHPLRVMLWSWLVADLMTFFQVLTVAYAFVPGGMPFRERTYIMLAVQALFLAIGMHNAIKPHQSGGVSKAAAVFSTSLKRTLFALLSAISIAAIITSRIRTIDTTKIRPYGDGDGSRVFTAGIQTVHFGLDQRFYDSSRRMADLYADLELDVFGLLESDLHRSVFGNRDLTQYLADKMGMYADLGPGPDKHTWGAALFSKFPIINSTHHLMPSPDGELAPAIHAVLDIYGTPVNVWVSHNGQEETPLDRQLQTEYIAKIASDLYPQPFVFLGYVVTKPHAERPAPYKILFEDGRIHDVEPIDMNRWCQYIGFRSVSRVGMVRVSRYDLTDTELQTAKFRVPDLAGGEPPLDPDRDDRPRLVNDYLSDVDKARHYPTHYIDPPAKVYERFKYSPWYYPRYYMPAEESG